MLIRKADIRDAEIIAQCLFIAMEDIVYKFIGRADEQEAVFFLKYFTSKTGNQYSYENCYVVLNDDQQVIAATNIYDGARLNELRAPLYEYLEYKYKSKVFLEDETEAGEIYIDCIGVLPRYQGQGIGSKLLDFLIEEIAFKNNVTLGLLVDKLNPRAKSLYEKLGFIKIKDKSFAGKTLDHMQLTPKNNN